MARKGLVWTPQQLEEYKRRNGQNVPQAAEKSKAKVVAVEKPIPGTTMNGLETRFETEVMKPRVWAKEIKDYRFNSIRLRLVNGRWYKCDFAVVHHNGSLEFYETKGFMREAADLRIRFAAEQYPWFKFWLVKRVDGEFTYKLIGG